MIRTPFKSRIDERTTPSNYHLSHNQYSSTQSYTRSRKASRPMMPHGLPLLRCGETLARVIFGILILFLAAKDISTANSAQHWQAVQGEIISKKIEITGKFRNEKRPAISYKYMVNGQVYISDSIQIGGTSGDAQKTLDSYPGKNVTVYFNPETPSEATLDRRLNQLNVFLLFTLAGLVVILLRFNRTHK